MTEPADTRLPVNTVSFWRRRVFEAFATGKMLHQCIWDEQYELWQYAQGETAGILNRVIPPGATVLDAGCGYGALCCCFQEARLAVDYTGIDVSPDLIELARYRYPDRTFLCHDLTQPTRFRAKHFDWAVVRSVREMLQKNVGDPVWQAVWGEVVRVSKRQLIIGYPEKIGQTPEYWEEEL